MSTRNELSYYKDIVSRVQRFLDETLDRKPVGDTNDDPLSDVVTGLERLGEKLHALQETKNDFVAANQAINESCMVQSNQEQLLRVYRAGMERIRTVLDGMSCFHPMHEDTYPEFMKSEKPAEVDVERRS